ncbi:MAG: hypothetical protein V8R75_05265 [Oscillospiraceae bacterium]
MKKAEQLVFDEDIYNTIRRNIKKYRNEKGLTSAQLAEMVDLSMTHQADSIGKGWI